MEAAGFVDVQIHRRSFDHGHWREGTHHFLYAVLKGFPGETLARAAASRAGLDAFPGYAFAYVAENLFEEYIPDRAERRAFAVTVQESVDGTSHVTFHMYFLSIGDL
jgi:hypothetical protein